MRYVAAVDIGGTNLRAGIIDENYTLSGFKKIRRAEVMGEAAPLADLVRWVRDYIAASGKSISALAVGVPSTVDRARRTVLSSPNIAGFDGVPLADEFEKALGIPVFLERDVSMIFTRDMVFNRLPEQGVFIGCYVGTGIGNAICIDGKLLVGKDGAAGEIGHIPMMGKTDRCGCGNIGCIELYAGGRNLVRIAEGLGVPIREVFTCCRDAAPVREYIDCIAIAVSAEINILNPDGIVLGGGVLAMQDFPRALLEERIRFRARKPGPADSLSILYSEEADENGVIGGGIYAQRMLSQEN